MPIVPVALALAQFAPTLMRMFGVGEASTQVAEKVIDIAQIVTGTATPEAALARIQADSKLAHEFNLAILKENAVLEQAYLADRANARQRDTAFVQAGRVNWRGDFLALLAVGALVLCVWFIASDNGMPSGAREAIMFVAGVFAGCVRDVYGFEFGSSRSSKEKDTAIINLRKG